MKPSDIRRFARARVIMRDVGSGRWLRFARPREFVTARALPDVAAALSRVEEGVVEHGFYAAGFVSYEAAPAFDSKLVVNDDGAFPLLWFGLYEGVEDVKPPAAGALPSTSGAPTSSRLCVAGNPAVPLVPADALSRLEVGAPVWQPSVGKEEFHRVMARIKALIRSGDTYQVNYTYRLRTPFTGNPWNFFRRLVAAQDPPYGAFVDTGEWVICSASPELFFRLDGGRIECRPMKGTAARGRTQAEDLAQARALRASEKERAENVMIVDMVRHDLGRVAQTGTVNVTRLFEVEKYPTIWQMTSTIEAKTEAGLGEIFRALFPAASVTGAPKVRTMQIIAGMESLPRRLYTGTIGFFAPGRRAQFNVAIRTVLANRKTGFAEYGVGSGITWDSDPEAEWRECRSKARILAPRVPPFSLLETMRWTPEEGYYLLDRHFQRLQESALYFGFRLDLASLRLDLERLSAGLGRTRKRIRLLVTKEGRITLQAKALPMNLRSADPLPRIPPLPFRRGEGRGEGSVPLLGAWSQPAAKQPSSFPKAAAKPQRILLAHAPVDSSDPFLYHKTTNRTVYEAARAACPGFDDVLLFNEQGEITESTIANVAVDIAGKLYTPPVFCGLLPGTLRAHLLQQGDLLERPIALEELFRSPRVFLFNSLRGIYPVKVVQAKERHG